MLEYKISKQKHVYTRTRRRTQIDHKVYRAFRKDLPKICSSNTRLKQYLIHERVQKYEDWINKYLFLPFKLIYIICVLYKYYNLYNF